MRDAVVSKLPALPTSLPGGELMPYLSAKRRHQVCDVVFDMLGGVERLHAEADKSSEAYWEFMKMWSKGLPRVAHAEVNAGEGFEALLDKLDAAERTIDVTPNEVDSFAVTPKVVDEEVA